LLVLPFFVEFNHDDTTDTTSYRHLIATTPWYLDKLPIITNSPEARNRPCRVGINLHVVLVVP